MEIAIDFGTSTTSVRCVQQGRIINPVELPNQNNVMDSLFEVKDNDVIFSPVKLTGRNYIHNVKRLLGKSREDCPENEMENIYGATVAYDDDGKPYFSVGVGAGRNKQFRRVNPEQCLVALFKHCVDVVQRKLDRKPTSCCLSIPNYIPDRARRLMKQAAREVGIPCSFMIKEPTAAGVQYFKDVREGNTVIAKIRENENVLVFDFGGGTLDLTIMYRVGNRVVIRAQGGDPNLGGSEIDKLIVKYVERSFQEMNGHALLPATNGDRYVRRYNKLLQACCEAKEALSSADSVVISIPDDLLGDDDETTKFTLTRTVFENTILSDVMERCRMAIAVLLEQHKIISASLGRVIMVGGSSKIPAIREMMRSMRCVMPAKDPQTVVVEGTMIASVENIVDSYLEEVLECDLACKTGDTFTKHIRAGTIYPTRAESYYRLTANMGGSKCMELPIYRWLSDHWHQECEIILDTSAFSKGGFFVQTQIRLEVSIDRDGELHYKVYDCNGNSLIGSSSLQLHSPVCCMNPEFPNSRFLASHSLLNLFEYG